MRTQGPKLPQPALVRLECCQITRIEHNEVGCKVNGHLHLSPLIKFENIFINLFEKLNFGSTSKNILNRIKIESVRSVTTVM